MKPVLNDSLDEFIALSQAANLDIGQNLEESDLEEDGDFGQDNHDSFDDLMSQVDDNDYLRMGQPSGSRQPSAKSKVNNWLSKVEEPRNEQNVQIRNANKNNFEVARFCCEFGCNNVQHRQDRSMLRRTVVKTNLR